MMTVKDDAMKRLAFLEVLECIAAGNTATLRSAGMTPETIERLSTAPAKDVPALARLMNLSVTLHTRSLNVHFSTTKATDEERHCLEYFIKHHATPAMIKRYFKSLYRNDIRQLRVTHGIKKNGRTPVLDAATAIQVYGTWERLTKQIPDERQRYIVLHRDYFPNWPMSALYGAINDSGDSEK